LQFLSSQVHGFVRSPAGAITEFDPPNLVDNFVNGINARGQIVGFGGNIIARKSSQIGFLRNPNGRFVHLVAPGAAATSPFGINDSGEIAGQFQDAAGISYGFLRDPSGTYTSSTNPVQTCTRAREPSSVPSTRMA
jgi:hypothetical protein